MAIRRKVGPSIKVNLELLRTLHRIGRQKADLESRLRRVPALVTAHRNHIETTGAEFDKLKEEHKEYRMLVDAKQGRLQDGEAKIEKFKTQLNSAVNNREYQALMDQIEATKMANSVLSDEILEGFERLDEFEAKVAEGEKRVAEIHEKSEAAIVQVQESEPKLKEALTHLEAELAEARTQATPQFLAEYERIVRSLGEDALSPIVGTSCGNCHQTVPLNEINKIALEELVVCGSCGAILYTSEETKV